MYNREKVGTLEAVVTQPYDKISPPMQEHYYAASPYNLVRIILGKSSPEDTPGHNVYTRAVHYFKEWTAEGALKPTDQPALFAYFQDYPVPGSPSERRVRKGFIGLGQIEDYSAHIVFPHERTLPAPKADRLQLLRSTRAHFEQLFMLYSDPMGRINAMLDQVADASPQVVVRDEYDTLHSLWMISDPNMVSHIREEMRDKSLIIADGHHRYETALSFRNECRAQASSGAPDPNAPYERVMMTFINMENAGLTILPTHRLVSNLSGFELGSFLARTRAYFSVHRYAFSAKNSKDTELAQFRKDLTEGGRREIAIGLYAASDAAFYLLTLRPDVDLATVLPDISPLQRTLDVAILHQLLLKRCLSIGEEAVAKEQHITYIREFEAGIEAVDARRAELCFVLNPTRIEQVRQISFAGETLPQKSTDFYPKLLSGLTIYKLE
jgi:uncharacterized protein (DUF1015 family)